jgi:predicted DNA-binding transcriptional regulator AlpA
MPSNPSLAAGKPAQTLSAPSSVLLTQEEVAARLKVSESWLAKRRMHGDGPPYVPIGRSIRYLEADVMQWTRSQRRLSTSE